ncbi:c-type heme family protein [Thermodesulfatator indicus]
MTNKFSILTKYIAFWIILGLGLIGCTIVTIYQLYTWFLYEKAKTVAEQVIMFRQWTASYGGIWTKDKYDNHFGYLLKASNEKTSLLSTNENLIGEEVNTIFYLHNPALATRELSSLSEKKAKEFRWIFKVVSDRPISPQGIPDQFEREAIKTLRKEKKEELGKFIKDGFFNFSSYKYRYVKVIRVKKGCLKCHGTPEELDPRFKQAILDKYGPTAKRGMNYKEGDIRGVISVTIFPNFKGTFAHFLRPAPENFFLLTIFLTVIFMTFGSFVAVYWMITRIKQLRDAARNISIGKLEVDLGVKGLDENKVKDELTQVAIALEKLRISTKILSERFKNRKK